MQVQLMATTWQCEDRAEGAACASEIRARKVFAHIKDHLLSLKHPISQQLKYTTDNRLFHKLPCPEQR